MIKRKVPAPGRGVLTVSEAARVLGVAAKTVREWSDAGKLPCQRTAAGFRVYDATEIRAFTNSTVERRRA